MDKKCSNDSIELVDLEAMYVAATDDGFVHIEEADVNAAIVDMEEDIQVVDIDLLFDVGDALERENADLKCQLSRAQLQLSELRKLLSADNLRKSSRRQHVEEECSKD
jgi:hypothetical protein